MRYVTCGNIHTALWTCQFSTFSVGNLGLLVFPLLLLTSPLLLLQPFHIEDTLLYLNVDSWRVLLNGDLGWKLS